MEVANSEIRVTGGGRLAADGGAVGAALVPEDCAGAAAQINTDTRRIRGTVDRLFISFSSGSRWVGGTGNFRYEV